MVDTVMSLQDGLLAEYEKLCDVPDDAGPSWFRRRGFLFERLLNRLLVADDLDPRTSYKAAGEQIDGSFFLDGSVFLLEAKWHAHPVPASTLYQFKGKVDGKLIGTVGVFISMSGYSKEAVDALTHGKSLNVILFDERDIQAALRRHLGFKTVLKHKLRYAAEEGLVYFPTEIEVVIGGRSQRVEIERLRAGRGSGRAVADVALALPPSYLTIVCEGNVDREVIAALSERILAGENTGRSIRIIPAMGKYPIPRVANAVRALDQSATSVLIVIDGDHKPDASMALLREGIKFDGWVAAIPDPAIESWLGLDKRAMSGHSFSSRLERYRKAVAQLDIEHLRQRDRSFAIFYETVVGSRTE